MSETQTSENRPANRPAPELLSLNTATVGKQWNLRQMIEATK